MQVQQVSTLKFDKRSFKLMIEGASADFDVTMMASKATIVGAAVARLMQASVVGRT